MDRIGPAQCSRLECEQEIFAASFGAAAILAEEELGAPDGFSHSIAQQSLSAGRAIHCLATRQQLDKQAISPSATGRAEANPPAAMAAMSKIAARPLFISDQSIFPRPTSVKLPRSARASKALAWRVEGLYNFMAALPLADFE